MKKLTKKEIKIVACLIENELCDDEQIASVDELNAILGKLED
jgi:hypothetical protein